MYGHGIQTGKYEIISPHYTLPSLNLKGQILSLTVLSKGGLSPVILSTGRESICHFPHLAQKFLQVAFQLAMLRMIVPTPTTQYFLDQ